MNCEPLPFIRFVRSLLTLGHQNFQYSAEGGHRFSSVLQLRMKDYDQYYPVAAAAIFFYEYFLTLADEVGSITTVSLY